MHSILFILLANSEYHGSIFNDMDFWLIMFWISYFILLGLNRDLFIKDTSFKVLLFIAIGLSVIANLFHFVVLNSSSAIMILNAPLICVTVYRLGYEGYLKVFKKPPLSPLEITYNFDEGIVKDRIFNFLVMAIIAFTCGLLMMIN